MDKRTRKKGPRKHAPSRPYTPRSHTRVPAAKRNGQRIAVAVKSPVTDNRPAWLKAHGDCKCIACFGFKLEVMAIYTGNQRYPYRCPYCGAYSPNSKEIKHHMGKIPNFMATCPQLETGVFEAGKIQYRDSGDMRLLTCE